MSASLEELARGLHGNVPRAEAKRLAKLHGHRWFDLRHAMEALGPNPFLLVMGLDPETLKLAAAEAEKDDPEDPIVPLVSPEIFERGVELADEWAAKGWIRG